MIKKKINRFLIWVFLQSSVRQFDHCEVLSGGKTDCLKVSKKASGQNGNWWIVKKCL